jgi:transposase-like protein
MPKQYAREFRRVVCARLVAGEKVSSLAKEVGVSEATLYLWKRQALIDAGRAEGVKSFEADELAQALKTIAELEAELEITRAAVAIQLVVVNPTFIAGPSLVAALRSTLAYFKAIIEARYRRCHASGSVSRTCATSPMRTSRQWPLLLRPASATCCWRTAR